MKKLFRISLSHIIVSSFICIFAYLLICLFSPVAMAQELPPDSVTVNPSLLSLDLSKDKPEGILTYSNSSSQTVQLSLSASDFAPLEDGYKLSFLNQQDAANYRYSLSSWIDFSSKTITISPHDSTQVIVFIQKEKLSPGGHYASIFAEVEGNSIENVRIRGVLASLLFVRTNTGHEKEEATILGFFPQQDFLNFPNTMIIRFNNIGDTTLIPYGLIKFTDPFGRYVAKGIVNQGSYSSLPESIRRFEIPTTSFTPFLFPGWYTARLTLHFGKENIQKNATITFFSQGSIPLLQILVVLVVGAVVFWILRKKLPLKRSKND